MPFHRAEASAAAAGARDDKHAGLSTDSMARGPVLDRAKGTVVYQRFYHLFEASELRDLAMQLENVEVVDVFFDKSNWCIIIERTRQM